MLLRTHELDQEIKNSHDIILCQGIKNSLNIVLCERIHKKLCTNISTDFECVHVKTIPHSNPIFESTTPKPQHWSFCFLKLKSYPDSLFMFFSDHEKGVFNRICQSNGNRYIINNEVPCVFSKNNIPDNEYITCTMDTSDILYIDIDNLVTNNIPNLVNIPKIIDNKR
jgi:hypothetical protein